jgi:hypothetical protein
VEEQEEEAAACRAPTLPLSPLPPIESCMCTWLGRCTSVPARGWANPLRAPCALGLRLGRGGVLALPLRRVVVAPWPAVLRSGADGYVEMLYVAVTR